MKQKSVYDVHFSDQFPDFSAILYHYQYVLISYLISSQRTNSGLHVFEHPHVFYTI